jgi:membrane-associated protease RseP (regulator of RpoE activity)
MESVISLFTTYLPYFVLVLTLLVFIHEFGHYWVARRFGIHAEVFSIGFGPELFGWTDRRGTRWKVSAIPLGGYVKFLGDNDETSTTPSEAALSGTPVKGAFFSKPLYARAAVVLGGPAANLLFAFLVLTVVFFIAGEPYSPATVAVQVNGPAAKAGMRTGDEIVRLADRRIDRYEDIQDSQFLYWAKPMAVEYRRGNQLLQGEIVPQFCERTDRYNNTLRYGELGLDQLIRPVVGGFAPNGPAEAAGLKVGDLLLEIDGKPVEYFSRIPELIGARAGQPLVVKYDRDDRSHCRQGGRLRRQGAGRRTSPYPSGGRYGIPEPRRAGRYGGRCARCLGHDNDVLYIDGSDSDGHPPGRRTGWADPHSQGGRRGIARRLDWNSQPRDCPVGRAGRVQLVAGADAGWRSFGDVPLRGGAGKAAQPQGAGTWFEGWFCPGDRHGPGRDIQ